MRDVDEYGIEPVGELTIGEAARALGIDRNAIRRWPPDELPYHAIGPRRDRRYRSEDVADYIESRARGARKTDASPWAGGRLERIRQEHEVSRTLGAAMRVVSRSGDEELARRLRTARSLISERLDINDR